MAEKQTTLGAVAGIRVSTVEYDLVAGPLRCTARLNTGAQTSNVKAIWRNEVGSAAFIAETQRVGAQT